jgi:crotonobetainyl-CoA:carnitine CoA-transferase CaiB-like acyl-CoA transferase
MASEQAFWKAFCDAVGRTDLFDRWPGSQYGDHARHNTELRRELTAIFRSRTSAEWIRFGNEANVPIAPVNTPKTIAEDPQFLDRLPWLPREELGCEQLPFPVKFDVPLPSPTRAPTLGQHTDEIVADVLGYDDATAASKREAGAFGAAGT